jgi:hypothetical protein
MKVYRPMQVVEVEIEGTEESYTITLDLTDDAIDGYTERITKAQERIAVLNAVIGDESASAGQREDAVKGIADVITEFIVRHCGKKDYETIRKAVCGNIPPYKCLHSFLNPLFVEVALHVTECTSMARQGELMRYLREDGDATADIL